MTLCLLLYLILAIINPGIFWLHFSEVSLAALLSACWLLELEQREGKYKVIKVGNVNEASLKQVFTNYEDSFPNLFQLMLNSHSRGIDWTMSMFEAAENSKPKVLSMLQGVPCLEGGTYSKRLNLHITKICRLISTWLTTKQPFIN